MPYNYYNTYLAFWLVLLTQWFHFFFFRRRSTTQSLAPARSTASSKRVFLSRLLDEFLVAIWIWM